MPATLTHDATYLLDAFDSKLGNCIDEMVLALAAKRTGQEKDEVEATIVDVKQACMFVVRALRYRCLSGCDYVGQICADLLDARLSDIVINCELLKD